MGKLGPVSPALDCSVSKKQRPGWNPGCPAAGSHAPQYAASPKDHGPSYPATPHGVAETTNPSISSPLFPPNGTAADRTFLAMARKPGQVPNTKDLQLYWRSCLLALLPTPQLLPVDPRPEPPLTLQSKRSGWKVSHGTREPHTAENRPLLEIRLCAPETVNHPHPRSC